jgi:hypothetical protein
MFAFSTGRARSLARDTGEPDAFLYRLRGEILLRLDSANSALAEQAFQTALAIARQQNRRLFVFVLRSALSLAKLYQSTGRPAEVRAVLSPALEGFDPTPDVPEVAEAQAILSRVGLPAPASSAISNSAFLMGRSC